MHSELEDQTPAKEKAADLQAYPLKLPKANREVKDSVFRDLFSDKQYLLKLYHALHPEDKDCTEDDLTCMTLEQILVRDMYNDLGFRAGDRLLVMLEAQSTWSVNIIVRALMYIVRTYQDYFRESRQSLLAAKAVHMPVPELYVVYTGNKVIEKEYITLSEEFFNGKLSGIEARVKVLTGGQGEDIICQYVTFTQIANEQIRKYGRTRMAITEAIRICMEQNVLREYLEGRQKEVVDIYATLFDQEQVMEDYVASLQRETTEKVSRETAERVSRETTEKVSKETAEKVSKELANAMYLDGLSVDAIARYTRKNTVIIEEWLGLTPQV